MSDKYTAEEMRSLTQMVIDYLDSWKLSPEEMIAILGLPSSTKSRHLQQYRSMDKSLPQDETSLKRIDHIVGIADALRTTFPFSDQMRVMWLRKPHRRFNKNTPLSVILSEGVNGLMRVRIEVDCSYGWAISEALNNQN